MDDDRLDETCDRLLDGRLILRQKTRGHRAGTDAILLAAAAPPGPGLLVDAGAGVGTAGLAATLRDPGWRLQLVERDPEMARLAWHNVGANGLSDRTVVATADFLDAGARRRAGIDEASADCVLCNPPFHDAGAVRISPDPGRAAAHVQGEAERAGGDPVTPWLRAIAATLRPGGHMVLIHRAEALDAILAACRGRFGAAAILPVHPREDRPAARVLVHATKGSRAPMRLLPGLVLHGEDGRFTPRAEAIHRGQTALAWT